eukprot:GHRR01011941.1.p1 GENE.GHRR01011941.1~~GHRR01011941.1.p1  ORF type:complete len:860 (+),score=375.52 GHRR01011941.1:91-2670(+)
MQVVFTAADSTGAGTAGIRLHLAASLLQLRGSIPATSPLQDKQGNILCFNGEIFGGLEIAPNSNDGKCLLMAMGEAQSANEVPQLLSKLRGPWSLIYWQANTCTLWFARDWLGRRSLLMGQTGNQPQAHIPCFVLTSVPPNHHRPTSTDAAATTQADMAAAEPATVGRPAATSHTANDVQVHQYVEVPPGIYSITGVKLQQYLLSNPTAAGSSKSCSNRGNSSEAQAAHGSTTHAPLQAAVSDAVLATPRFCQLVSGLQYHNWQDQLISKLQQYQRQHHLIPDTDAQLQTASMQHYHHHQQQQSPRWSLQPQPLLTQQQQLMLAQHQQVQEVLQPSLDSLSLQQSESQQQDARQQQERWRQKQQQEAHLCAASPALQEASQLVLQLLQASVDVRCLSSPVAHEDSQWQHMQCSGKLQHQQVQQHHLQQQQEQQQGVRLASQGSCCQPLQLALEQQQQFQGPTLMLDSRSHSETNSSEATVLAGWPVAATAALGLPPAPVLILFSGGVDSTLIAALAHRSLSPDVPIELSNVCFDGGTSADRLAARSALLELAAYAPNRQWRLIEVDSSLQEFDAVAPHVRALLNPANTVMDLNIGVALWLATKAMGRVVVPVCEEHSGWSFVPLPCSNSSLSAADCSNGLQASSCNSNGTMHEAAAAPQQEQLSCARQPHAAAPPPAASIVNETGSGSSSTSNSTNSPCYVSAARVVLLGHGADEQCAGYGRHRTKYRLAGWQGLADELALDVKRLWIRNLGRDDRLVADHGREGRHPFLDESLMAALLDMPLNVLADLRKLTGVGDKHILREALRSLGLPQAAGREKRAIQFGSKIGQLSNKRDFGSNRRANKYSAGSVAIDMVQDVI